LTAGSVAVARAFDQKDYRGGKCAVIVQPERVAGEYLFELHNDCRASELGARPLIGMAMDDLGSCCRPRLEASG
jgi:hypothetical protein